MSQTVVEQPEIDESEEVSMMQRVGVPDAWDEKDLAYGQPVIVAVRWIMIVTALFLAIWNVESMQDLRLQFIAILLLALTNFYLNAQLLMKKPLNRNIVYAASAVDIIMISLLVMFQGGYTSSIFVFYLPAVAAFAVAFPGSLTALYTLIIIGVYGMTSVFTFGAETDVIVARLIMIAAVAFCGSLYLQIEHRRRSDVQEQEEAFYQNINRVSLDHA